MMSKIYCSNCGKYVPERNNFCQYCGAAQHGKEASVYQVTAPVTNPSPASFLISNTQKNKSAPAQSSNHTNHEPESAAADNEGTENPNYIKRQHLCKKAKLAFFINYIGSTAVLPILFFIGAIFDPLIAGIAFVGYIVILYLIADMVHNNFYFCIDKNGFKKEHGIIHKQQVSIPYNRIQNVNITRGLVDRMLGLARISIETAGSNVTKPKDIVGGSKTKAEGYLPGVGFAQAKVVHDLLLSEARKHGAGSEF